MALDHRGNVTVCPPPVFVRVFRACHVLPAWVLGAYVTSPTCAEVVFFFLSLEDIIASALQGLQCGNGVGLDHSMSATAAMSQFGLPK